jgi:hypothetical protein
MSIWDNPRFWLSAGALLSVTAIQCLLALWAATATKRRLERVVIVWIAIMLLVPIRAYEPALIFTIIAGLIIVLVRTIRHGTRERPAGQRWWSGWFRFSLADIFTLTLFVCTILGMGALCRAHPGQYFAGGLLTLPIPIVVALSYFSVTGPYRVRMTICLLSALFACGGYAILVRVAPYFPSPRGTSHYEARELFLHGILLGLLILLSYFLVHLLRAIWNGRHTVRESELRFGKWVALSVVATLLAFLGWYYCTDMLHSVPTAAWNLVQIAWATSPMVALAVVAVAATFAARGWRGDWGRGWQRTTVAASACLAAVVLLPLAWLYWQMLWPQPIPPFASDEPTHYNRLIAIARQWREKYARSGRGNLDAEDRLLLAETSALLKSPNYIPVAALELEVQRPFRDSAFHHHDLWAVMGVFEVVASEARTRKEHDQAADLALDLLRFGTMLQRGGTHHSRMGWDAHRGAFRIIDASALEMSTAKRRQVIQALEDVLEEREDPAVQQARAMAYDDRIGGWHTRFSSVISEVAPRAGVTTPVYNEDTWMELTLRATQIELAVIQFKNERVGQLTSLEQLVPDYLGSAPLDPYTGRPLLIRVEGNSYVLYSVGHDGIDDGGKFAKDLVTYYQEAGYDLKLPPQ